MTSKWITSNLKAQRDRLFRKSRPYIRPFEDKDWGILWAAYKRNSFGLPEGMAQEEFMVALAPVLARHDSLFLIEDDSPAYQSKRGPVGLVGVFTDTWLIEPHADWFAWATKRNVLRCAVAWFQKVRHDKHVGACMVRARQKHEKFFTRLRRYGVLFYVGKVPNGFEDGDMVLYSVRGKKCPA